MTHCGRTVAILWPHCGYTVAIFRCTVVVCVWLQRGRPLQKVEEGLRGDSPKRYETHPLWSNCGRTVGTLWSHGGHTVAHCDRTVAALSAHCFHTVVTLWSHCRHTVVALWPHGGYLSVVAGRSGPPPTSNLLENHHGYTADADLQCGSLWLHLATLWLHCGYTVVHCGCTVPTLWCTAAHCGGTRAVAEALVGRGVLGGGSPPPFCFARCGHTVVEQ